MPRLKQGEAEQLAAKEAKLAPFIEAALARKPRMQPLAPDDVPIVKGYGARKQEQGTFVNTRADRGGGIAVVSEDPTKVPS